MLPIATLLLARVVCFGAGLAQEPAPPPAAQSAADELAEQQELAIKLLNSVRGKAPKDFAALLEPEALVERAVAGLILDSAYQRGWRRGSVAGMRLAWAREFPNVSDESKVSLAFLRVRGSPKDRSLLFRMRSATGDDFTYLEFWTGRGKDGRLHVIDWVDHLRGQPKSQRVRVGLLTSESDLKRPDKERAKGLDRAYVDHSELVRKLTGSIGKEGWAEALGSLEQLPIELRRETSIQLVELRLAAWTGDVERMRACYDDLLVRHPESFTADIWAFAHDLWGEDEERVLASLHRLRDCTGGDSQLDYLECEILLERRDLANAKVFADRARASEPDWIKPRWVHVALGLLQRDHAAVLAALIDMDGHFELAWEDFTTQEAYKEFVASPQHAEWLRHLAQAK
jgi:hypothetical protein